MQSELPSEMQPGVNFLSFLNLGDARVRFTQKSNTSAIMTARRVGSAGARSWAWTPGRVTPGRRESKQDEASSAAAEPRAHGDGNTKRRLPEQQKLEEISGALLRAPHVVGGCGWDPLCRTDRVSEGT